MADRQADFDQPSPAKRIKLTDDSAPISSSASMESSNASIPVPEGVPEAEHLGEGLSNGAGVVKLESLDGEMPMTSGDSSSQVLEETKVKDESSDEEDEPEPEVPEQAEEDVNRKDMYLDTVNPQLLDFDFERLCSKSLTNINVYCCLVCGRYFQGRGRGSWAYRHSVGENHRVWLNLDTEKFYVLPEGYQVTDPSLQNIINVLNPQFKPSQLPALSALPSQLSKTLNGDSYIPGFIGLNNIRANDYSNVIIHLLLHTPPIRDFFLDPRTPQLQESVKPTQLVKRFAQLARRLWNPKLFKSQASPHEFLQEVAKRSEGKFGLVEQGDPVAFLGWLLNNLHRDLGGGKKRDSSIIYRTFQGEVRIETQEVIVNKQAAKPTFDISRDIKNVKSPFLFLALDLPAMPLFQDINERKIIPQIPLVSILAKFDGVTTQEIGPTLKRHHLTRLPQYLLIHVRRFTSNVHVDEKNPTIVTFPLRGLDLAPYVDPRPLSTVYDLLGNVPLESTIASTTSSGTGPGITKKSMKTDDETRWKVHLRAGKGGGESERWYALHDLETSEVRREMVFLGETVLQIWERREQIA